MDFEELMKTSMKAWRIGYKEIVVFMNCTWNDLLNARAVIRGLLRQKSGHIGEKDTEFYNQGQELEIWMEARVNGESVDCIRHGIYEKVSSPGHKPCLRQLSLL